MGPCDKTFIHLFRTLSFSPQNAAKQKVSLVHFNCVHICVLAIKLFDFSLLCWLYFWSPRRGKILEFSKCNNKFFIDTKNPAVLVLLALRAAFDTMGHSVQNSSFLYILFAFGVNLYQTLSQCCTDELQIHLPVTMNDICGLLNLKFT